MTVNAADRAAGVVVPREPREIAKTPSDATRNHDAVAAQKEPSPPAAAAASSNTNLRFHVDKDSGKTVVAWVDQAGKVLRQLPSEEAMAVAKAIDRFQGVFLNRKA